MSGDDGLSGEWTGIFNYPDRLPPTQFEATLRDHGGVITGETAEPDLESPGQTLHAVVEGSHEGSDVRFTKMYDDMRYAAEVVHYHGTVQPGGDEIEGRWEIPGVWSGTFLMIKGSGAEEAEERRISEEVGPEA